MAPRYCRQLENGPLLTTFEAAALSDVSTKTVVKWIDSGLLAGIRLPGSKHRRVEKRVLAKFLLANGMPVPEELRHYVEER